MNKQNYDIIVIGGGAAGLVSAKFARGLGKKVAIVDREKLGGECTWTGCIPSKTLIRSAKVAHEVKNLDKFGLRLDGNFSLDASEVMQNVQRIIQKVYQSHKPEVIKQEGIDVYMGGARFIDSSNILAGDQELTADKFIVCTGTSPFVPPIKGLDSVKYYTNSNIFSISPLPKSMIVIGVGPIGVELSEALNRLGVQVTAISKDSHILLRDDQEVAQMLQKNLIEEGLNIQCGYEVIDIRKDASEIIVKCKDKNSDIKEFKAESLLVATGRKPNIDDLDLEKANIEFTKKGIVANKFLQTSQENIYVAGDVVGPYQFSHMAEYQAVMAVSNALLPINRKVDYTNIAWTTYTDPELAHAGLTEKEARDQFGNDIHVYTHCFNKIDRAITDAEEVGMSKVVTTKKNKILGIHILGHGAGELMHEVQLAKVQNIPFDKIQSAIHAYPSYSDVIRQPSKKSYVDKLESNPFVKLFRKFNK